MRKIMACLDVGSDTIKLVVGEIVRKKLNILAVAEASSKGVQKGIIEHPNNIMKPLQNVIQKCEEVIGLKIRHVLVAIPASQAEYSVVTGSVNITNEGFLIEGKDVIRVLQKAVKSQKNDDLEYISIMPSGFALDDNRVVKDPKGLTSKVLSVKGVMVSTPKVNVYPILSCLEKLGIDVLDIALLPIGDYFEFKTKITEDKVGIVINLGDETTTISVFNKGILTNSLVLPVGGRNIDNDISFIYKVSLPKAKELKENFALAHKNMAQATNTLEVTNNNNESLTINQFELSEIVMSRLDEILNLCKKEINGLTKKEISYIIFTGGLVEIKDFSILLNEIFKENSTIGNITEIGARSNKYGSCLGLLKYYAYNAKLKDKDYSIFTIDEQQMLSGAGLSEQSESIIDKLFGYIFNG